MADGVESVDPGRAVVEQLERAHYGGQADAMLAEQELLHRMLHRYLRMAEPPSVLPRSAYRPKGPNVYDVMAALADEVRQYDREQLAKTRAGHHGIGMVHASHEGCGLCDLKRANDLAKYKEPRADG